ncbi:hypothetical protein RvY_12646 [Ramazzottius varieornatus]|uniref:Uncharacterized protein n=1 Tax=Ramazzottius varieornatus TaxID=947166 RepID=A0A1D1VPE8_RAMVA|nr:hypothetical protein RvY_12646 [Ramazzottius varieornatus]
MDWHPWTPPLIRSTPDRLRSWNMAIWPTTGRPHSCELHFLTDIQRDLPLYRVHIDSTQLESL